MRNSGSRCSWPDGPAVVLVPAAIGSRRQYEAVAADLAADFTVVTVDPRGQGDSPNPRGDYLDHEDMLALVDTLGIERAGWVGCSNGGRIVADVAVEAPDRVGSLVLLGPSLPGVGMWDAFPEDHARIAAADADVVEGEFDTAVEVYADLFVVGRDRTVQDLPDSLARRLRSLLMAAAAREQGAWDFGEPQSIQPMLKDRLHEIEAPTLVAVGTHDHPAIHGAARRYREALPDVQAVTIQGVAHLPAYEAPAVTAELIRDHLSVASAATTPRG